MITCSACGALYNRAAFEGLPKPRKGDRQDDGDGGWLILRNCSCGTTLAIPEGVARVATSIHKAVALTESRRRNHDQD